MNIQLLAFDIDGTLLDWTQKISSRTLITLRKLDEKGVVMVPITGRCLEGIPPELLAFKHMMYAVTSNGARTVRLHDMSTFETHLLDPQAASQIARICEKPYAWSAIHMDGGCHDSNELLRQLRKTIYRHGFIDHPVIHNLPQAILDKNMHIEKIQVFAPKVGLKSIKKELESLTNLCLPISRSRYLEISDQQANKGSALVSLCNYLKIDMKHVMVIGDGDNDLSMLEKAGYPVAMGNAIQVVKDSAKFTTSRNTDDGFAKAVELFLL